MIICKPCLEYVTFVEVYFTLLCLCISEMQRQFVIICRYSDTNSHFKSGECIFCSEYDKILKDLTVIAEISSKRRDTFSAESSSKRRDTSTCRARTGTSATTWVRGNSTVNYKEERKYPQI